MILKDVSEQKLRYCIFKLNEKYQKVIIYIKILICVESKLLVISSNFFLNY